MKVQVKASQWKKIIGYSVRCPHPKENTYAYKKAKAKNTTNGLELKKKNHMDLRSFLINKTLKDTNRNKKSL